MRRRSGAIADGAPAESRRPIVGPGLVLFVAVVSVLAWRVGERRSAASASGDGAEMSLVGIMGQDARTSSGPAFKGAEMMSIMGGTKLDLRDATLDPGQEASISVFGLMGGVEIFVPRGWEIDVKTVAIMGGVKDQRPKKVSKPANGDEAAQPEQAVAANPGGGSALGPEGAAPPRLVIHGLVVMGGLVIRS